MDDTRLAALLRDDPQAGLTALVSQYRGLVAKICGGLLAGHREDMEEVIADTFICVWKSADRFDAERGSLKSLLAITARHNAINRWKQLQRPTVALEPLENLLGDEGDALSALLEQEDAEEVQTAVNALTEPDREIFVRRYYLLEPVREIAQRLGLEEKQISNRLYQTKLRLREVLKERGIA